MPRSAATKLIKSADRRDRPAIAFSASHAKIVVAVIDEWLGEDQLAIEIQTQLFTIPAIEPEKIKTEGDSLAAQAEGAAQILLRSPIGHGVEGIRAGRQPVDV